MRGTLAEIGLKDVICLIGKPAFVGRIDVDLGDQEKGAVLLANGRIVGAFAPGEAGIPALITLLKSQGTFETEAAPVRGLDQNISSLTVEQLVQFDQSKVNFLDSIHQRVPSVDLVPRRNWQISEMVMGPLMPNHFRVIFAINDERSIREISAVAGLDELTTCCYICELQDWGVVAMELSQSGQLSGQQMRRIIVRAARSSRDISGETYPTGNAGLVLRLTQGTMSLAELWERSHLEKLAFLSAVRQLLADGMLETIEGDALLQNLQ